MTPRLVPLHLSAADFGIRQILILKADRLCASILQQSALRVFPAAQFRIATSLQLALAALREKPVDMLLTGVGLLDGDAIDLLSERASPARSFRYALVITGRREPRILATLRSLQINGIFDPMSEDLSQLEKAIQIAGNGKCYWSPSVQTRLCSRSTPAMALCRLLSPTEQLVLAVIGDGCDDVTAADRLNLKPSTIHSVRRQLHRKLGVQHKGELVRVAVQHGYVRFTAEGVQRPGISNLLAACGKQWSQTPWDEFADSLASPA